MMFSGPNSPHRPTVLGVIVILVFVFALYHFGVVKRMG